MLESSGFRKYSTLLVIQLFSPRLCLCHCLCIRLCLCICVPYSFLNSFYQKLSENVWVWGSGASWSGDVTMAGQTNNRRKDRATKPMDHGRLRWAIGYTIYSTPLGEEQECKDKRHAVRPTRNNSLSQTRQLLNVNSISLIYWHKYCDKTLCKILHCV